MSGTDVAYRATRKSMNPERLASECGKPREVCDVVLAEEIHPALRKMTGVPPLMRAVRAFMAAMLASMEAIPALMEAMLAFTEGMPLFLEAILTLKGDADRQGRGSDGQLP
eukprot:3230375-Rhodomonas_salina.2